MAPSDAVGGSLAGCAIDDHWPVMEAAARISAFGRHHMVGAGAAIVGAGADQHAGLVLSVPAGAWCEHTMEAHDA